MTKTTKEKTTKEVYGIPVTITYFAKEDFYYTEWEAADRWFWECTVEKPTDEMIAGWVRQTI
jgi:hypothetical protein